jgi:uncharacterized protein (DUF433 family)
MRNGGKRRPAEWVEPGRYVGADPKICHGKPTLKGTGIIVWQMLAALARAAAT